MKMRCGLALCIMLAMSLRGEAYFVCLWITQRAGAVCAKRICAAVAQRHGVRARKCSACRTRSLRSGDHSEKGSERLVLFMGANRW